MSLVESELKKTLSTCLAFIREMGREKEKQRERETDRQMSDVV